MEIISRMASIDWERAGPTLFIHLTFPNKFVDMPKPKISQYLHDWRRGIERYLGRRVCLVWRLEWEVRKSGKRKGHWFPHFHILMFNVRWIPYYIVNALWQKSTGWPHYIRTETKRMANSRQACYYVCKYIAKEKDSLVYGAYLSTPPSGRHWGVLRKALFPVADGYKDHFPDSDSLASAYAYAKTKLPPGKLQSQESFRLFGDAAKEIGEIIFENALD